MRAFEGGADSFTRGTKEVTKKKSKWVCNTIIARSIFHEEVE